MKDLLNDESRNNSLRTSLNDNLIMDLTHTKIDSHAFTLLKKVAEEVKLFDKIEAMFTG